MLEGKVCIVTGASRGIGRAIAVELVRRGAIVALAARSVDELERLAGALRAHPGSSLIVPTDVTRRDDVEQLVATTVETCGRLDVLINNAGRGFAGPVALSDPDDVRRLFEVNVFGPVYAIHAATPHLAKRRGVIVNVSSPMGRLTIPGAAPYSASKAALDSLTEALRIELEPQGIDVLAVYPYLTRSNFFEDSLGESTQAFSERIQALSERMQARAEAPEDVAVRIVDAIERRRTQYWSGPLAARLATGLAARSKRFRTLIARKAATRH